MTELEQAKVALGLLQARCGMLVDVNGEKVGPDIFEQSDVAVKALVMISRSDESEIDPIGIAKKALKDMGASYG